MITPIEISPSSVPGQIKIVKVAATARKQVVFKLTDDRGRPVDLRSEAINSPATEPTFGTEPAARGENVTVVLRAKVGDLYGATKFDIQGTINADTNYVEFLLTSQHTAIPGVYAAEIGRFAGDSLVDTWPVMIQIEPSAFQTAQETGPVTIPEVRLALMDVNNGSDGWPFSNLLIDVEFADADIAFCIRRVVEMWNETPPPVAIYSTDNFPYRYWWTQATMGHLLQMAGRRYSRNRLAYSAGGVSVDDQSKAAEYLQHADQIMQEFRQFMMTEKQRINMSYCWSTGL
jgi:hypothetical protein